jgi:hypothetical protein
MDTRTHKRDIDDKLSYYEYQIGKDTRDRKLRVPIQPTTWFWTVSWRDRIMLVNRGIRRIPDVL